MAGRDHPIRSIHTRAAVGGASAPSVAYRSLILRRACPSCSCRMCDARIPNLIGLN